jgi:hypothetical protein
VRGTFIPPPHSLNLWSLSPVIKLLEHEACHLRSFSDEVKNAYSFTSLLTQRKNLRCINVIRSRDSSVGIVTGYGLDDRGVGVRVPVGTRIFSLHIVQTGSRASPASSSGLKRLGREADDSHPTSAEVKNTWIYISTPHTPSWRSA